ncbi:MAG: NACHT domain-containing protein, partial [Saprospiraceae bacterium]
TYKNSLNDIRQCLEWLCWAIIVSKNDRDCEKAKGVVGENTLGTLIQIISNKKWFDTDEFENRTWKERFSNINKKWGNPASHAGTICQFSDWELATVEFKKVIPWFWKHFLPEETLPEDIQTVLNGTLLKPDERERRAALHRYYEGLKNEYQAVVLNDDQKMTLAGIYIEPGVRVWKGCLQQADAPGGLELFRDISKRSLHRLVNGFFVEKQPAAFPEVVVQNPRLLLLLGQPGQGKTSFCQRFLHDHIRPEERDANRIFYIRLRDIASVRDLFNDPLDTLQAHVQHSIDRNRDYLDKELFCSATWVLDGLDELAMREANQQGETETFIKDLLRLQDRYPDLYILLTSRFGQVDLDKFRKHSMLVAAIAGLTEAQQLEWLGKYKGFHPECSLDEPTLRRVHAAEEYGHLRELMDQPIVLHLMALAGVSLDTKLRRAAIYGELFDKLCDRSWADNKQIDRLQELTDPQDLRVYIREVAFAIYASGREYLRKADLEALPASEDFIKKLGSRAQLGDVLRYLMVAFYMQEVQKSSADTGEEDRRQYAVEFLHKSLQEYLVAEKIWESIKAFGDKNSRTGKYAVDTADQALALAWGLFARKPMSEYVYGYLREHIENDQATDKAAIFDRMLSFAPELLEKQFLHEIMPTEPLKAALHTFADYWAVLAALQPGRNTVPAGGEHRDRFVDLLRIYPAWDKKPWNLSGADLMSADLGGLNLIGSNLSGATLIGSNLSGATLIGSNLSGATLMMATLTATNLIGANLSGANLGSASLIWTNLANVNSLTSQQLQTVYTLYQAQGVPPALVQQLNDNGYQGLFEDP